MYPYSSSVVVAHVEVAEEVAEVREEGVGVEEFVVR